MEKALLVVTDIKCSRGWGIEDKAAELVELARSSGTEVVKVFKVKLSRPNGVYFIGKGKAEEIREAGRSEKATTVIFNDDLSPSQQRNLEKITGREVIDRTQLILDIFARRAASREGKIQVELAQLDYSLPRLSGRGVLLSRLGAGLGTRGPGEQELEVDRRRIRMRITKLKNDLKLVRTHRELSRTKRKKQELVTVVLVGYTNAGKSTLINALTGAGARVAEQLFSTLDPLVRKFDLPSGQRVLITDTVGFLHELPHHLIDAFQATLEGVREADILLEVVDISHPRAEARSEAVREVLRQLRAENKPIIYALNKIDRVDDEAVIRELKKKFARSAAISALKKEGLGELVGLLTRELSGLVAEIKITIPLTKMNLINLVFSSGRVTKKEYQEKGVYLEAVVPTRVKQYIEAHC